MQMHSKSINQRINALIMRFVGYETDTSHQYLQMKYCREVPSNQTAVDILQGEWLSAFPKAYQVEAGRIEHFDFSVDPRIKWADSLLPDGLKGLSVLELGPFEAYNTWQLEKLGASPIVSIEANNINFLKCLIVKEITGLSARFLHGDFIRFLEQYADKFDIVWSSGVLYHQIEPLKLLGLISKVTDRVFIHTHYYVAEIIRSNPELAPKFDQRADTVQNYQGYETKLHHHSYSLERVGSIFSGGAEEYSYWMERQAIFDCLEYFGFNKFQIGLDHPNNPNGPAMFFLANKSGE